MGIMPWSPLAGGFLSGKYQRGNTADTGRLSGANPFGNSKFVDRNWDILDVLKTVAAELDRPAAQVALAWLLSKPTITAPIVGATKLTQLTEALAAVEIKLTPAEVARLEEPYVPHAVAGFS